MSVWKGTRACARLQILITSEPRSCSSHGNVTLPNSWPKRTFANFAGMSHTWICVSRSLPRFQQAAGLSTPLSLSSPLCCPPLLSQPFSPGDALEVIITVASGFISIYSHNNTEKWQTDGPGVMYYPLRESSFIMTTSSASSLCQHSFSPFFFSPPFLLRPPLYCR